MKKTKEVTYKDWVAKYEYKETKETKDEFDKVARIMKDLRAAKDWRASSCKLTGPESGVGGDYGKRWDLQMKFYLNWSSPLSTENFRSNVKLTESVGRIESLYQKVRNLDYGFTINTGLDDEGYKAKCLASRIDYELYKAKAPKHFALTMKDALIHGTGIFRQIYVRQQRKVRVPKKADKENPKEIEAVKNKKILYEEKTITKYNGISYVNIPRHEFFEAPRARVLHGVHGVSDYVIWRRVLSYEQFMEEYGNRSQAMNLDKIKDTSSTDDKETKSMFDIEDDVTGKKYVTVLEYECEKKDEWMVTANDHLILDGPLPYEHKNYTFYKVDCITDPYAFNGISLVDRLENTQSHMEILINMMMDKNWRQLNQKYFIESTVFGELTEKLIAEDSLFIPVNTSDGRPLQAKLAPMYSDYVNQDSFQLLNTLGRTAVMGTLMDTSQLNLQKTNVSATALMESSGIVDETIAALLKNMHDTLTEVGFDMIFILKQKRNVPKVVDKEGKKYERFPIKNYKLVDHLGKKRMERTLNEEYWMESSPELFSIVDQDIRIAPKNMRVVDKNSEREEFKVTYAQMMANAVDPSDPSSMQFPGVKLYDARILGKKMVELNGLEDEVLLMEGFDEDEDLEEAIEEVQTMLSGQPLSGMPGRSMHHNLYEKNVLDMLNNNAKGLQEQLELTKRESGTDMMGNPLPPQYDPGLMQAYEQLLKQIKFISDHLQVDVLPKNQREAASIVVAQELEQLQGMMNNTQAQAQMPEGGQPAGQPGGQVPMPPSTPNMMQDQGAGVPMPQTGF